MLEATALTVILMSAMHQMRAISANMLTRVPTFRFCNGQVLVQSAVFQAAKNTAAVTRRPLIGTILYR
jgi:hypothetical protein